MVLVQKELNNAYIGEWVDVTSLTLNKSSISLTTVWQTEQIIATTVPAWATVNWSSDDTTVATVSSSWLVTCVSVWTCTITAESFWVTATCNVLDQQWWTPWANTIAYRPLTDNLNDIVWGYNLTPSWSDYSFTTSSRWGKCLALNLWGTTSTTYLENTSVHTQLNQTWDFTFAFKIWEWVLRLWSWTNCSVLNFNRQCNIGQYSQNTQSSDNWTIIKLWEGMGFGMTTFTSTYNVTDNALHSCVITLNRTQGTTEWFVDWNIVFQWTQSGTAKTMTTFVLGKDMYDSSQGRYVAAKISHCVIESGVWDSQRIADYNNL